MDATKNRKYLTTHPWIIFQADLSRAGARMWMNLGEARSKCEHIANEPLRPDTAHDLLGMYLAKGVLATTAIEGNTLTEKEVRLQVDGKLVVAPSREYLWQESQNIIDAVNEIKSKLVTGTVPPLFPDTIKEFNSKVLAKLTLEPHVIPGAIRTCSITVGASVYLGAPAEDCEYLLGRLCDWLTGPDFESNERDEITYAIIKAVIAHLYVAWIHPFGDGNGRTARLMEVLILMSAGVPDVAAHLLSNHYNETRQEYYRQLAFASRSGGDILPFLEYAIQGFVDGLRGALKVVKQQQMDITWENYVVDHFRNRSGEVAKRQQTLAMILGDFQEAVPVAELREIPELTGAYAGKTLRTVQRDVNDLAEMGLVRPTVNGVVANKEVILSFLPVQAKRRTPKQKADALQTRLPGL